MTLKPDSSRRLLCATAQSPPPVPRPPPLMRNRNDKQAFIVDSEQKGEWKSGKHAFPDGVVEKGKRVRRAHDPCFRFLYGSQESPSKALAPPLLEPG